MDKKISQKGFSLMDVIFAIGIITIGLVGILGLFRYVILAQRLSADRFIATNLAQEGIEIIRDIRDTNVRNGGAWNNGLNSGWVEVSYKDNMLTTFTPTYPSNPGYNARYLKLDQSVYSYNYDSGTQTKYKRYIYIEPDHVDCQGVKTGDCFAAISYVEWDNYRVGIEDVFYNWR